MHVACRDGCDPSAGQRAQQARRRLMTLPQAPAAAHAGTASSASCAGMTGMQREGNAQGTVRCLVACLETKAAQVERHLRCRWPSRPLAVEPQVKTSPADVAARECSAPAAMLTTPAPDTAKGMQYVGNEAALQQLKLRKSDVAEVCTKCTKLHRIARKHNSWCSAQITKRTEMHNICTKSNEVTNIPGNASRHLRGLLGAAARTGPLCRLRCQRRAVRCRCGPRPTRRLLGSGPACGSGQPPEPPPDLAGPLAAGPAANATMVRVIRLTI